MLEKPELPLAGDCALEEPTAGAAKFSEDQARAWLAENANAGVAKASVRELAVLWGWSRSTTQRFLSRSGDGTAPETGGTKLETGGTAAPVSKPQWNDEFDWSPENGDIAVPPQPALAVYANAWGQLVIRNDDDMFICVSPEHVPKLIDKMRAVLKELERDG